MSAQRARFSDRLWLFLGACSAAVSVAAGAFGAHAAQALLSPQSLAVFETAVRYQMLHAIALCCVAFAGERWNGGNWAKSAGALFVLGTLLFSGALYAVSLAGWRQAAALAPLGGASFIAGWACLAWLALRAPRRRADRDR